MISVGDIVLIELGIFCSNKTMSRLVKVRVDALSHDGLKAVVTLLPPDPNKKNTINAEKSLAGRFSVVKISNLFRSEDEHKARYNEFQVGDAVVFVQSACDNEYIFGTVMRVNASSVYILANEGKFLTVPTSQTMTVSRTSSH